MQRPKVASQKNQFPGINPHLHDILVSSGEWRGFHTLYLAATSNLLKAQLFSEGYSVGVENSLQISRPDDTSGNGEEEVRSDLAIYDTDVMRPMYPVSSVATATLVGEQVMPATQLIQFKQQSDKELVALAIYEQSTARLRRGHLVAWIELLSPANKRGRDKAVYQHKREELLRQGIVFVELDYLHQYPPTFDTLPPYRFRKKFTINAHPYRIVVIDPRPTLSKGVARLYEFDVDAPIPTPTIPLNGKDIVKFDFGAPYQKTFEESLYGLEFVDYSHFPEDAPSYSPPDTLRIARRMLAVNRAKQAGQSLDNPPLQVEALDLDATLAALQAFGVAAKTEAE